MMTIGAFSAASKLSVKTLRMYESEGILAPDRIDSLSGYRLYGDAAWRRAEIVKALRELGFGHQELRDIVGTCSDDGDLAAFFEKRLREVESDIRRLRSTRDRLNLYLRAQGARTKETDMKKDTEISEKALAGFPLCGIRYKGRYGDIGERFAELFRKAGRHAAGAPLALYYDGEYREDDADIEAAIPVKKSVAIDGLDCRVIGETRALCALHYGPYETLGDTYKILFDAIEARSLVAATPTREIYLKGPGLVFPRKKERFVTEIQIPVEVRP